MYEEKSILAIHILFFSFFFFFFFFHTVWSNTINFLKDLFDPWMGP